MNQDSAERDDALTYRRTPMNQDSAERDDALIVEAVPMLLHCPLCSAKHIDEGVFATKPHHTHACQGCGHVWRPAKINTYGVQFLPGYKNEAEPAPKPDRWTLAWEAANEAFDNAPEETGGQAAVEVLRRRFPDRPVVVLPEGDEEMNIWKAARSCYITTTGIQEAEIAAAAVIRKALAKARKEAKVVVPEKVRKAAELWKNQGFYGSDGPMILARFVKKLIAQGGQRCA